MKSMKQRWKTTQITCKAIFERLCGEAGPVNNRKRDNKCYDMTRGVLLMKLVGKV